MQDFQRRARGHPYPILSDISPHNRKTNLTHPKPDMSGIIAFHHGTAELNPMTIEFCFTCLASIASEEAASGCIPTPCFSRLPYPTTFPTDRACHSDVYSCRMNDAISFTMDRVVPAGVFFDLAMNVDTEHIHRAFFFATKTRLLLFPHCRAASVHVRHRSSALHHLIWELSSAPFQRRLCLFKDLKQNSDSVR